MYSICVGEYGMDPSYFLDKASIEEVSDFIDGASKRMRPNWEQIRMLAFVFSSGFGGGSDSAEEFMPLPWDSAAEEVEVDAEAIKILREKAKKMERSKKNE